MWDLSQDIREIARKLLQQKEAEAVIGFEKGTIPFHSTPCFVRDEGDVDKLVWDAFCGNNLAKYLTRRQEKVAVVARGCDARTIVELIKEKQLAREQVIIIGTLCHPLIDSKRIEEKLLGRAILKAEEKDGRIVIKGIDWTEVFETDEYLHPSCKACSHRNPVIYDILIGDKVEENPGDSYPDIARFEGKSPEERWAYFSHEIQKCIRCYACRNACPLCYCEECFVDHTRPQWIGKTVDLSDTMVFHIMRAFHMGGRCVDCGACERACPMGVDFKKLTRKLMHDVKELYGYESGASLEDVFPLAAFRPDDPEEFILNP
jgi:formate dehydrogenase subunit beta